MELPQFLNKNIESLDKLIKLLQCDPPPIQDIFNSLVQCQNDLSELSVNLSRWFLQPNQNSVIHNYRIKLKEVSEKLLNHSEILTAETLVKQYLMPSWLALKELTKSLKQSPAPTKSSKKEMVNSDWKTALKKFNDIQLGHENFTELATGITPEDKEIGVEDIQKIFDIKNNEPVLLSSDDHWGIIKACVTITRSFMPKKIIEDLNNSGYGCEWVLHQYLILKNATLFGTIITDEDKAYGKIGSDIHHNRQANRYGRSLIEYNKRHNTSWVEIGPLIRRKGHIYGLIFPSEKVLAKDERPQIYSWDFLCR